MRLVSPVDSSTPVIEFEAKQPHFKSKRYEVSEGSTGVLVDATPTKLKTNLTDAEVDPESITRVFVTSRRKPTMRVRIVSVSFPNREVQRNIYGRHDPLFHPSRNKGTVQVEFVGDEFDKWLGFLAAAKHKALSHRAFVSFANRASENKDEFIDEMGEGANGTDDDGGSESD